MARKILSTTREGWGRIFGAVRQVENGGRSHPPIPPQYRTGDDPGIVLGKTPTGGNWVKGASAYIDVYAGGAGAETATGYTLQCFNKFATVGPGKWVMMAGPNQSGLWYLISAECS
ncbi:hypothetical protein UFOVP1124_10 [uncultured Caudovirales phage]|uniref:Uncharacterized protein n=1 Tax=uncultured Caudovirales phage TaxID=2100421 RepID=A0A6J5QJC3_9CAUD|nr:hypothetical protein UFOVP1124_10 [uncultured Caudovirales phage]